MIQRNKKILTDEEPRALLFVEDSGQITHVMDLHNILMLVLKGLISKRYYEPISTSNIPIRTFYGAANVPN